MLFGFRGSVSVFYVLVLLFRVYSCFRYWVWVFIELCSLVGI